MHVLICLAIERAEQIVVIVWLIQLVKALDAAAHANSCARGPGFDPS